MDALFCGYTIHKRKGGRKMEEKVLSLAGLEAFRRCLVREERSANTVEKYLRDARAFYRFLGEDKRVDKERVIAYKQHLAEHYKTVSANSMLAAVNRLLLFLDWRECQVRLLRVQKRNFRETEKELTKSEYQRLLAAAKSSRNERLWLLMQAICGTGIRVSEHRFITVEAVRQGRAQVRNKGRERVVFFPAPLKKLLLDYCRRQGVGSGPVFVTRSGCPMDRSNIWAEMKRLCESAGVDSGKVFPHNLRHLFAVTYYQLEKDIVRLADVLGHASVETTRIYTATSGLEQKRLISRLGLVGCGG